MTVNGLDVSTATADEVLTMLTQIEGTAKKHLTLFPALHYPHTHTHIHTHTYTHTHTHTHTHAPRYLLYEASAHADR